MRRELPQTARTRVAGVRLLVLSWTASDHPLRGADDSIDPHSAASTDERFEFGRLVEQVVKEPWKETLIWGSIGAAILGQPVPASHGGRVDQHSAGARPRCPNRARWTGPVPDCWLRVRQA